MRKIRMILLLVVLGVIAFFGASKVWATSIPTVSLMCESKSGVLFSTNDGYSILKTCPKGMRLVTIIGTPGPRGEKGDTGNQGPQGIQGSKGDQGDPGFIPDKTVYLCFNVPTGAVTVMRGGSCGTSVIWKVAVQCIAGKPCQPDNPNDSYYVPLQ